jgi:hypothetical protein
MSEAPAMPAARSRGRGLLFLALPIAIGGTAGGLYAHFIGCRTGTCPITSSVPIASLYGAFVGLIVGWPGRRRHGGSSSRQAEGPHPPPEGAPAPPQR